MIRELVQKEILEGILSFKFVVMFLTSALLILLAFVSGLSRYEKELQAYTEGQAANEQQMGSATDWADLGRIGLYVFRKPTLTSIFGDSTQSAGQSAYVSIEGPPRLENSAALTRPLSSILQELDFTSVVKLVLSLFALLFAYDAICGEKEIGTLQLILANPISRSQVILGKIIGRYLILVLPVVLSFLMGVLLLSLSPEVSFERGVILGVTLMLFFSLIYLLAFYLIGLTLSGLSHRSSIALILCLFSWICLSFIIPRVSSALGAQFRPIPSYTQLEARRIQLSRDRSIEETRETTVLYFQWQQQWTLEDEAKRLQAQLEFQDKLGQLRQRLREKYQRLFLKLWEDYQYRQHAQTRLAAAFSRLSLSGSYSLLMTSLTHTGPSDQQAFITAVMTYHRQFRQAVEEMIQQTNAQMTFVNADGSPMAGQKPDLTRLPPLKSLNETDAQLTIAPWLDMTITSLYVLVFFTAAYVAFLRYDPR
jgi:ABC-type transport system involved in multi-copper enzyme maturation permease subunit